MKLTLLLFACATTAISIGNANAALVAPGLDNVCDNNGLSTAFDNYCYYGNLCNGSFCAEVPNNDCNSESDRCSFMACGNRCVCAKTKPANCDSGSGSCTCTTTEWTAVSGQNYESRTYCSSSTDCNPTTQYRCKAGYYGTNTSCSECTGYTYSSAGSSSCSTPSSGYYATGCSISLTNGKGSTCTGQSICPKGSYCSGGIFYTCPSSGESSGTPTTAGTGATSASECYIASGSSFSDGIGGGSYTGNCYY